MEKIKLLKAVCCLEFGYYPNNTIAILATKVSSGELWCVPTINYEQHFQGKNYRKIHGFPIVVIKNYGENEGIYAQLIQAGVITRGFYLSGSNGGVQLGILTEKWQAIAKKQLKQIKG